jgi:hypothetical protein
LVPRLAVASAVGAMFLVGMSVLFAIGGTRRSSDLLLLPAAVGVSVPIGVLLGFLIARRIWSKCMPSGTYRRRPVFWWLLIPIVLISFFGYRMLDFFPYPYAIVGGLGILGVEATFVLGMALFERRAGCYLSLVGDPNFWTRWVEYRVEPRGPTAGR